MFQQYELRLSLLSTPYHVKQHAVVRAGDLYMEQFGHINASYGKYTFNDVKPGQYNVGVSNPFSLNSEIFLDFYKNRCAALINICNKREFF